MYCNSLTQYQRFKTREVKVGNIGIGGNNPIRIQSMTTTDTLGTMATVEQSIKMIDAGCEIVRITAPSIKEAENLANIKSELRKRGYNNPLVADIHFTPNAAEVAARIVEKVRINPGNYADKKKFETLKYTDETYKGELERLKERFVPLVKICKEYGTAMRIGTNHGSLSDRIMSRYGDSPQGMVESAMEFIHICRELDYHEIVLSMKASNTLIVIQAYRLLVSRMLKENMNYPLHLGVTEAGDGEDGRIKSAVGIGSLLEDGLGDTIRVSLTEDPEFEIPVAKNLVEKYNNRELHQKIGEISNNPINPFEYNKRKTREVLNIGNTNVPRVIADFSQKIQITPTSLYGVGYRYSVPNDKWNISDVACDYLYIGNKSIDFEIPGTLGIILNYENWTKNSEKENYFPLIDSNKYLLSNKLSNRLNFISIAIAEINNNLLFKLKNDKTAVPVINTNNIHGMAEQRRLIVEFINNECFNPIIIHRTYDNISSEQMQLYAATDIGSLLADGLGDGVFISSNGVASTKFINDTSFGILQATRTRISKTEYISCPSCGRTLFNLQETTSKIRAVTSHLKGVKIGIMGCIVNGPGEMADADYGYVGTGEGKITLYKEKEIVRRNIPEAEAVNELIKLIKEHGDWIDGE